MVLYLSNMNAAVVIYWILVIVFCVSSLFFGFLKVKGELKTKDNFVRWGYPFWFMKLVGFAEMLAALGLLFAETRLAAIIVFAVVMTGAVCTNLFHKEKAKDTLVAVFVFIHLVAIYLLLLLIS